MADYGKLAKWSVEQYLAGLPQSPKAPASLGILGKIHNAIDPASFFGPMGVLGMALPSPTRAYHGTSEQFETFQDPPESGGHWFSTSSSDAARFARMHAGRERPYTGAGQRILPVDIQTEGLPVYDYPAWNRGDPLFNPFVMDSINGAAQFGEHAPGMVVRNVQNFEGADPSTTIVLWEPGRARSAITGDLLYGLVPWWKKNGKAK